MAADDVSLPDLEVIAQFSLAVRAATAPRAQVVAALEADLAALTGQRRSATPRPGSRSSLTDSASATGPASEPAAPPRRRTAAKKAAPARRRPEA